MKRTSAARLETSTTRVFDCDLVHRLIILAALFAILGTTQIAVAAAGTVTQFPLAGTFLFPDGITSGPDGALWFLESGHIGRISTSGAVTQITGPTGNSITSGPDGALWFTESSQGMIARFTTAGSLTLFPLPGNPPPYRRIAERPQTITVGPDGALWFTVQVFSSSCVCVTGGKIGRITTAGTITEFTLPTGASKVTTPLVGGIAAGPDGALWFTDSRLRKIGRLTTPASSCNLRYHTAALRGSRPVPTAQCGSPPTTARVGWSAGSLLRVRLRNTR